MNNNANSSYDDLPYPNYVFPDTHPARIASAALLFGLSPTQSSKAKILEIGCGSGINILSPAAYLPDCSFVALDPSEIQIEKAKQLAELCNIKNVTFLNCSIENFNSENQSFDYIICHGVFSWVSINTQHQILLACRKLLSANGIAYISYNTLPGWHIQNILRDLSLFDRDQNSSITEKNQTKELLKLAGDLFPGSFQEFIKNDIQHLIKTDDAYLTHEYLAKDNNPLYFSQFSELLEQHGLCYLAESDIGSMLPREFSPEIQDKLNLMAKGKLSALEQYCDFFRLRRFRKTLVVKDSVKISRSINWDNFKNLFVTARRSHTGSDFMPKATVSKTKFNFISEAFPASFKVSTIINDFKISAEEILEAVMLDDLELRDVSPEIAVRTDQKYKIAELISQLAKFGRQIPNLRSENVQISENLRLALAEKKELAGQTLAEALKLGLLQSIS